MFVDGDYGCISEKQLNRAREAFGTELINPDLVAFADSFGIDGYRRQSSAELRDAFETAIGGGMPLIAVEVG